MSILYVSLIALVVSVLDRLTKSAAEISLSSLDTLAVIPGIFHLTLVHNTGAAFGLLRGGSVVLVAITFLCVAAIFLFLKVPRFLKVFFGLDHVDAGLCLAFGLILGGAVGNLIDRLQFSYVIDFLDFRIWPVFNVADSAITVGAGILFLKMLFSKNGRTQYRSQNGGVSHGAGPL
ncbi:MAG: signal peptidase II [Candidatus Omnitrophica bacterium]|nr:signal peptidase II [Candidatus Omnitrophota bacterium]MDD5574181.1 signal peptidase II [Candidatus Omnitrophota bacterium]